MSFLFAIFSVIFTIFLIIGVHEFAHFKMAQWLGVKVLTFSIGFGKTIYSRVTRNGTEFRLGAIPLGGYVRMLDEDEDKVPPEELPYAFNRQPFYKKALIVIAGPLSNLVLAFLLYWLALTVGYNTFLPIIDKIEPHSIAEKAALPENSILIEVNHKPVQSWNDVILETMREYGDNAQLEVKTQTRTQPITVQEHWLDLTDWTMNELNPSPLESLGIRPYFPEPAMHIASIQADSPASHSPLKIGDVIVSIKKQPVNDWLALFTIIREHPDEWVMTTVKRQQKLATFPLFIGAKSTWFGKKHGFLGISPPRTALPSFMQHRVQYAWQNAILPALDRTVTMSALNLMLFEKMVTGRLSLQSLSGPVTIAESINDAFQLGWGEYILFLAFLNVAIGIVNLLPIPALDGGQLAIFIIEAIRQRAFTIETRLRIQYVGLVLLLFLMLHALLNDFLRLY